MPDNLCESCMYYTYDEEADCYVCDADLDQDEEFVYMTGKGDVCPCYNPYDEYGTVRKQN
ncbi:MAG: DUF6472 family protein [Clostridiales bacterium]|nr:DUF6472 family protein [Clostridiales bacterium]